MPAGNGSDGVGAENTAATCTAAAEHLVTVGAGTARCDTVCSEEDAFKTVVCDLGAALGVLVSGLDGTLCADIS